MAGSVDNHALVQRAITFAGGLALGAGGVYALSRASFKPASAPTKSTKDKAREALANASKHEEFEKPAPAPAPKVAPAADKVESLPASEQLDARDAKGTGHLAPVAPKGVEPALPPPASKNARHALAVAGGDYPEPAAENRARAADLKADLSSPAPAHLDQLLNDKRAPSPAWITGLVGSPAARDTTAAGAVEGLAYSHSQALFVYESEANAGFGASAEKEAIETAQKGWFQNRPKVVSMQTRAGAGTAIAGYLSSKGTGSAATSADGAKTVSALTNASGLLSMGPAVATLPSSAQGRLVIQASSASQDVDADTLAVKNDYASVLAATSTLSVNDDIAVVLSGSRQEAVDVAAAAYSTKAGHVVHVFDGAYSAREIAKLSVPAKGDVASAENVDIVAALQAKKLTHFSYYGPRAPSAVVVVPNGSHATAARTMLAALPDSVRSSTGIIAARILRPWSDEELAKVIPSSVRRVFVLDEVRATGVTGPLFEDVQGAVFATMLGQASAPKVLPISFPQGQNLNPGQWSALFEKVAAAQVGFDAADVIASAASSVEKDLTVLGGADSRIVTFYDVDSSNTAHLAPFLARTLRDRSEAEISASLLSRFDNYEAGGLVRHDLLVGAHPAAQIPVQLAAQEGATSTLVISDPGTTLKSYNVFKSLRVGGTVLVNSPGWDSAEFAAKLRAEDKKILAAKKARVYLIDASAVVAKLLEETAQKKGGKSKIDESTVPAEVATAVLAVAFYRLQFGHTGATLANILTRFLGTAPLGVGGISSLVSAAESALVLAAYSDADFATAEPLEGEAAAAPRPSGIRFNGFHPSADAATVGLEAVPVRNTWALPAWQLCFAEAYSLDAQAMRPDLAEENWTLTVTENRRLTPLDYDRNVFHMELSTAGTGMKYEVGEALGVHGWNDDQEVKDFIQWSGYDPDELLAVPSATNPGRYDTRTVFQVLQQRLDIFGKPGKSFFAALSKLATNKDEAKWLRFISSPEGNSTFKKLSEIETVTYAEVLQMFPSARLPLDILLREVEPIEPRHYSISSAQALVGDSVHLLIVTVDWKTPSGSPRYGQCTRYLANLKPGAKVTVSLKPSIMKLPPHTTQPIIMAGLGTGMAPFRAFVQAREVQKRNGEEVGPLFLYFGSRYRSAEWLYGEDFEAWHRDGLVNKMGLAFSRDQKQKVYIQHKIQEDSKIIANYLTPDLESLRKAGAEVNVVDSLNPDEVDPTKKGIFTLCGSVDPVPAITEAVIQSFMQKGCSHEEGAKIIEKLKEEERFVLEVY